MNKELIKNALEEANCLMSDEIQFVILEDLQDEYQSIIEDIDNALENLTSKKTTEVALERSLRFISEEYQFVILEDLKEEFERVILQVEVALKELKK